MGRHNTIAGRMASASAARARLFTKLAREIMVSAKNGSDASTNSALRAAVTKAKDNSMPKENIERAIKKGSGEFSTTNYEEITYEGYGPGGCAVMIEVLTDNKNRTHPEIRRIFEKNKGNIAEMGAVSWVFQKFGVFIFDKRKTSEDDIMNVALEAGAEDVQTEDNFISVYCPVTLFGFLRDAFVAAHFEFEKTGLELIPNNFIELNEEQEKTVDELLEKLADHDDVQNVYHNVK